MLAAVQYGVRDLRLSELPDPTPAPGEALIRTRAVTICASDVHMYAEGNVGGLAWDRPFVPGHEAAGTVHDPNCSGLPLGAPVVLDPAIPCRACDMCRVGAFHLCPDLKFLDLPPVDGAMRELIAWPADRVFPLPETLAMVEAPLIEPLAVAVHALEIASSIQGAAVAIIGCGAIGLFTLQMARLRGAQTIIATDHIPERLALAQRLGADVTVNVTSQDPAEAVSDATAGRGVDTAFEAAGPHEALLQCLQIVRPAGRVVVIGIPSQDEYRLRASHLRRHELTLRFVRRQNENYPEALALVREGRILLQPILTHRFPIRRVQEAFELAERKGEGAVRVAVTFD
jgi:L-iditol 2-dehydrogenase